MEIDREKLPPSWLMLHTAAGGQAIFPASELSAMELPGPDEAAAVKIWLRGAMIPLLAVGDFAEIVRTIIEASQAGERAAAEEQELSALRYANRVTMMMNRDRNYQ